MTSEGRPDSCFTDFALQEYVHGRLAEDVRREVESHVVACAVCGKAIKLLNSERSLLRDVASSTNRPAMRERPDWATLAAYMDGALDSEDAARMESALLADPVLLESLISLQREASAVLEAPGEEATPEAQSAPSGQTLRMPQRAKMPPLVMPRNLRFGGGQTG